MYVYMGLLFLVIHGGLGGQRRVLSFVCVGPGATVISSTYLVIFNSRGQNHKESRMSVFHMVYLIQSQAILFGVDGHNEICSRSLLKSS